MQNYKLITITTRETLFAGFFKNFTTCLETAIVKKIPLNNIDLRGRNLTNANLDDGIFSDADFSNTNLTGANMSETYCRNANFENASLFNTCLAYSNMSNCNFKGASFGATDMSASLIDGAQFSTLSAFTIDFSKVRQMRNCTFHADDLAVSKLSKPPIVITGLRNSPIMMLDDDIYHGPKRIAPKANKPVKIN